jgi:ArsR family transcriptional regulator
VRKLADAGLVVADRKVGNFTYYRVVPEALRSLADVLGPAT